MKIKLTLRGRTREDIDLLVTTDATATVGDVAAALASSGPRQSAATLAAPDSLTLRVLDPVDGRITSVLPSTAYVTETGLNSGSLVDIASAKDATPTGGVAGELRVLDGNDKGMCVPLYFGGTTVGRSPSCTIMLNDRRVSKEHARITVGSSIEIHDLNSANGVLVGNQRVQQATVTPGDVVLLGDTQIQLVQTKMPESTGESTDIAFIRSPQVIPHAIPRTIKLPDAPTRPKPSRFPFIGLVAPLIMGASMFLLTRQLTSLVFIILSPIIMIGSWWDQRRQSTSEFTEAMTQFEDALKVTHQDLDDSRREDVESRHAQFPPIKQTIEGALRRDGSLWIRRPEHPEFLKFRLGQGTDTATVTIEGADQRTGLPEAVAKVRALAVEYSRVTNVPLVADIRSSGGLGLCGPSDVLRQARGAIAAQLAAQYSPAEVIVTCMTSTDHVQGWEWMKWLPHCSSPHSPFGAGVHLASDSASAKVLLSSLEGLLEARTQGDPSEVSNRGPEVASASSSEASAQDTSKKFPNPIPAVVVFVDDVLVDRARLNRLAELGPDRGIYFVWMAPSFTELPAACRSFIAFDGRQASIGDVRASRALEDVSVDRVSDEELAALGRSLSPLFDAGVPVDDDSDLPGSISYVDLTGQELADDPNAIIERWRASHSIIDRTPGHPHRKIPAVPLSAIVGQGASEPMQLDLRLHGPHALVGGTTGAGKSEFLQAWVLGMAQSVSPDRLTFLFVDYKGGSAFEQCTDLPHTVGLVTDLSPYLVRRALTSLRAELHYRERLLNKKRAKDLVTLEKSGDPDCPPSLVIVVDEFAALVNEVPEFIDGVVDVAQRGRSLGLHLILATQRPAGVIKDNLRANTNLRVALRMADTDDSQDVLGDAMAAHFPQNTPGRAAAKTGPGRISVFQSAYPGARTAEGLKTTQVDIEALGFGLPQKWKTPEPPKPREEIPTDITRVVGTICAASAKANIQAPRKPWLPELAPIYDLSLLPQRSDAKIVLGVLDDPEDQSQEVEYFRPDTDGHIAFYGASGSGKTTALRSLAIAAGITPSSGPVNVYALDFAGGGLDMLKKLPSVGNVIQGDDEERIAKLIDFLGSIVDERSVSYKAVNASHLTSYRELSGKQDEPRYLVLIDGIATFAETYQLVGRHAKIWSRFQQILSDGREVGVHFAVSADRPQAIPNSIAASFQRKVVLRLTDEDAYLYFNLPRDVLSASSAPGRAMQVGNPNLLQLPILGRNVTDYDQAREIESLAGASFMRRRTRPTPIRSLPLDIPEREVDRVVDGRPVIGVEAGSLAPMPLRPGGTFAITGPAQSGRTNTVRWLARSVRSAFPNAVMLHACARRSLVAREPLWTETAQGADKIASMLAKHGHLFEEEAPETTPGVVLFVEGIGEFSFSACDQQLQDAIASAKANGHLVVAEADVSGWSFGGSLASGVRSGRTGIVLCPSPGEGENAVGVPVPGIFGAEAVPGRGYFVQSGKQWKVQVPRV